MTKPTLYRCPECGLHYSDATTANQCAAWCRTHQSCNLAIARTSIEATHSRPATNGAPPAQDGGQESPGRS